MKDTFGLLLIVGGLYLAYRVFDYYGRKPAREEQIRKLPGSGAKAPVKPPEYSPPRAMRGVRLTGIR